MGMSATKTMQLIAQLRSLTTLGRDASMAFRLAIDHVVDEPLTRFTLMSFRADHERHLQELDAMLLAFGADVGDPLAHAGGWVASRPAVVASGLIVDERRFASLRSTTAVLRLLKYDVEVIARTHQECLRTIPAAALEMVRNHTNDCLRHRAWVAARVDAFVRTLETGRDPSSRDSRPSMV